MIECVIGLGANLNNPQQQLLDAAQHLLGEANITQFQLSSLYSSTPMGPQDQPDYVNGVAIFHTTLTPHALLDLLQHIEQLHGRVRSQHWGPRTLDLDLLFYGNKNINDARLTVPHPGILEREFVIVPLAELRPNYILPNNKSALSHANTLNLRELQLIHPGLPIN
ncbi:2-amino-4-hydroxy-6-hydroxymethyldihydropteridine diphosphokinase [Aliidiomarina quisquiliarum]|uniref:2-amino-4-hydroxy-6- hydroxymethyldihydropteridine diphosphokinase n=1 Tax=Aliidiomarina quisquiliarum TaxID=2938947 RepID=UPI00208F1A33|nr:2-amino-4-hydroxy-6-hydroxymethyldihydropteridine diphosphokinase [Aliidiomarina quisquiliarum]MCO4322607.1 2-amino-4-hydroxy-6-hydroxymethyldihydropteridine diphosphokinase [Aliidiomarina quisquiliarum]